MVLQLFALLFTLGITFMHSMFGLFSGLINTFCCVISAVVAFGFSDVLNGVLTEQAGMHPSYSAPCSLILLFLVTLAILRFAADNLIRGNVRVPLAVDWIGGALCGFVNAQICVGTLVLAFLMLPWGDNVMMYSRYERTERKEDNIARFERSELWLRPDAFTTGLVSLISGGSLRGGAAFASVYPDFPEWVWWSGNTIQHESTTGPTRDKEGDGHREGIKVDAWWVQTTAPAQKDTRYRPRKPTREEPEPAFSPQQFAIAPGKKLIGVRLTLNPSSGDRQKDAIDHRFRPTMIRLVGDVKRGDSLEARQFTPRLLRGAYDKLGESYRIVDPDNNLSPSGSQVQMDALFEVPENFSPRFVEYRRYARAGLSSGDAAKTPPAAPPKLASKGAAGGGDESPTGRGPARFIDEAVDTGGTGDKDELPWDLALDRIAGRDVETGTVEGDTVLVSGRLVGDLESFQSPTAQTRVRKIKVPEGKRIFMLKTKARKVQSLFAKVFNLVGGVTSRYSAVDKLGNEHLMTGYIASVKRDGKEHIELLFTKGDDPTYQGGLDLKDTKFNELSGDDASLTLIFLVPPGSTIMKVINQKGDGVELDSGWTMREK